MLRTLTVSVLLAFVLSPVASFSQDLAKTMQVDALWDIGLTGQGYNKIGMWVGDGYPHNHEQFFDRIEIKDDDITPGPYTNHETSATGIIIAAGIDPRPEAKGIAYEGILKVYNATSWGDEIEIEAAAGLELVSYSFESLPCYFVGEATIDDIAYRYPNLLFIQSAGNATLSGQGKNNLAVGSASYNEFGVIESQNSAIGPSNDGRIKPDLVAPGGTADACEGINEYGTVVPATSFAAPAAAGVGVLLQQHYQKYIDGAPTTPPMQAATLKALLIHTAEEAGPVGPDAEFGWGLINAKRAAEYITVDKFNDNIISNDMTYSGVPIKKGIYSDGTEPIKVTMVWTDPPADAVGWDCSDTSPRLIHDLDLKITKGDDTFYPWTLNSEYPAYATNLIQAGNHKDNVEQVYITANHAPGVYTIEIGHSSNLSNDGVLTFGTQAFSMIISGLTPRSEKQLVLAELQELYSTGEKKIDTELEKAINCIESSLNESLWEDGSYLTENGKLVFVEEKKAVKALEKILKEDSIFAEDIFNTILDLIEIDKTLAQLMIDKAIENNGDISYIEKALEEMEEALDGLTTGSAEDSDGEDEDDNEDYVVYENDNYDDIVFNYKKAWQWAYGALKKVGLAKYNTASEMVEAVLVETHAGFSLGDNYPNPFNPTTTISFNVPEHSDVSIAVYNLMGEKIRTLVADSRAVGNYQVNWDGTDNNGNAVSTGMYFYELKASDFKQVKRMTFMK